MDRKGSIRNVDGPSVLIELHVPRRELERNFETVLFWGAENARVELKSCAMKANAKTYPLHQVLL
jgi:hypothetical protein